MELRADCAFGDPLTGAGLLRLHPSELNLQDSRLGPSQRMILRRCESVPPDLVLDAAEWFCNHRSAGLDYTKVYLPLSLQVFSICVAVRSRQKVGRSASQASENFK